MNKTTKLLIIIVGVLFLAATSGWAGLESYRARAAQQELDAFHRKQEILQASNQKVSERIESQRREHERQQAILGQLRRAKRPPAAKPNQGLALVARNPRLLELYLKSFRANLGRRMGPFYQSAGLSSDQIDRLEDIMSKREEGRMDLMATAAAQGLPATDPALVALRKQQSDQAQVDETALLGDSGYQQLQDFNRSQGALQIVNGAAFYAPDNEPYTKAQSAQLTQILANASPPYAQGGQFNAMSVDWDSVLAQAAAVLSSAQLSAFKTQTDFAALFKLQAKFNASQSSK